MAVLQDLIAQIPDASLRSRISAETQKLLHQKKFGLVFEDHVPECCPLYDVPIRCGSTVARRSGSLSELYTVLSVDADNALCAPRGSGEKLPLPIADLLSVAEFGEPIYPYLAPIDSLSHAPASAPWHTLIEADNFHALQLLAYLYPGKVDCIYIDPPYNTGAHDWKYNNDYVDGSDAYRHSKWLSMMEKRLRLAKKLLNPADSVLIVTIDEKEYLHLGCLLEEMFPEARMQMVSITMNHAGTGRKSEFARVNEFAFYVTFGDAEILPEYEYGKERTSVLWDVLRRSELSNTRDKTKTQFYPIFINDDTGRIHSIGDPIPKELSLADVVPPDGCTAVFPIRDDGIETMWGCRREELLKRVEKGYIRIGKKTPNRPQKYSISYIKTGAIADIESGKAIVEGYAKDGSVIAFYNERRKKNPPTVVESPLYDARIHGSGIIDAIIGRDCFSFPKSLYAVKDCLKFVVANKPRALILDFFAGSGTTLHAVNLLNAEDGGERRCILVTNNEVSDAEAKTLTAQGHRPGDSEWEALGIARYVTWPRTVCSMEGHDVNGVPLKGEYLGTNRPMADGFSANAVYFKLGFLDKTSVSLGRQFRELLPLLWMKAGARGPCPELAGRGELPEMLILPENGFAVLLEETAFPQFEVGMRGQGSIETVYLVTNHAETYRAMSAQLGTRATYQLYKDYLDNFRINHFNRT